MCSSQKCTYKEKGKKQKKTNHTTAFLAEKNVFMSVSDMSVLPELTISHKPGLHTETMMRLCNKRVMNTFLGNYKCNKLRLRENLKFHFLMTLSFQHNDSLLAI